MKLETNGMNERVKKWIGEHSVSISLPNWQIPTLRIGTFLKGSGAPECRNFFMTNKQRISQQKRAVSYVKLV
jgi:hypothetical protein